MNGQGLNTKDKNSQKDIVGNLMVYPNKWLSVGDLSFGEPDTP